MKHLPILLIAILFAVSCSQEDSVQSKDVRFHIYCPDQNELCIKDYIGANLQSVKTVKCLDSCTVDLAMIYGEHRIQISTKTAQGEVGLKVDGTTGNEYWIEAAVKGGITVNDEWGENDTVYYVKGM